MLEGSGFMPFVNIKQRTVTNWTPVSYTANETTAIMPVHAGEMVIAAFVRIRTAFDGGNSDAAIDLGDGGDTNRLVENADLTETTAGLYHGSGAGTADDFGHLYTADDTIDVVFTADTGADGTVGAADIWIWYVTVEPH